MAKKIKQIDDYIARSADFAKPVLNHFRELVHKVCPDVEEKMKWSMPYFDYKGSMMCFMASFKEHCAFGFWKASLFSNGKELVEKAKSEEAMGHFGKVKSLKDLPKDSVMTKYIKEAMRLNDEGVKLNTKQKPGSAAIEAPDYFMKALRKNKAALATFQNFAPGNKKEYVLWIMDAKTDETREKRLQTAIEWMSEGKTRNWKYQKK